MPTPPASVITIDCHYDHPERAAAFLILDAWGVSEETRSLWDADHIVPVVEGGGGCGLGNYRTLCVVCHRGETALLASRRAGRGAGAPLPRPARAKMTKQ